MRFDPRAVTTVSAVVVLALCALLWNGAHVAAQGDAFAAYTPTTCAATNNAANRYDANALACVDCSAGSGNENRISDGGMRVLRHTTPPAAVALRVD